MLCKNAGKEQLKFRQKLEGKCKHSFAAVAVPAQAQVEQDEEIEQFKLPIFTESSCDESDS